MFIAESVCVTLFYGKLNKLFRSLLSLLFIEFSIISIFISEIKKTKSKVLFPPKNKFQNKSWFLKPVVYQLTRPVNSIDTGIFLTLFYFN